MREDVYARSGMRLLDNLNFQSDEFSLNQVLASNKYIRVALTLDSSAIWKFSKDEFHIFTQKLHKWSVN